MANIFDYLKDVAYDSYYDLPLNELDILTLIEITYLSFDNLVSTLPQRLLDLAPQVPREPTMLTSKNRLQLLDELAQHKRFKNCKLSHFINDIDPELQKQFAAMTYRVSLDTYLIVFRGTDDSIIGWKEDFHLTYMKEIPAQKHALRYLKNFFAHHPKQKVILAGHSKGGNLAIYAASQIEQSLQNQITAVYTFDAPGLHQELTQTAGYQRIMDRSKIFIPQGSIIGMMLEIPAHQIIVQSTALGGIAQHDTFSWQIEDKHFVQLDKTNSDSRQVDTTFKEWVTTVPDEELQLYFDLFFGTILDAGISSINDLASLNPNHSYLSQLDVTYKTPDLMSHFLPPHEVSFTFCCSSIVFPRQISSKGQTPPLVRHTIFSSRLFFNASLTTLFF
ncbi:lipase [Streptococcus pneumoniae]|nr:lipase [Streptococcus pneumoniae]